MSDEDKALVRAIVFLLVCLGFSWLAVKVIG